MKILRLEEMTKVASKCETEVICKNHNCLIYGYYVNCYLHTHVQCPKFAEWYEAKYRHMPDNSDMMRGL